MNEEAKAARRAYKRAWQRANRDKVKQYQTKYWNRKAQEAAATTSAGDPVDDHAQEAAT